MRARTPLESIGAACAACGLLAAMAVRAQSAAGSGPPVPAPESPAGPASGASRWFDPSRAPFIPVPEIAVDPNAGTTLGLLPVWLQTDADHHISHISAPDFFHNENFGYGLHGRVYSYPSADEQWSIVVGIQQRVQRGFDLEYQRGRERLHRWSFSASLVYDKNGSPRFFGIGNETSKAAETNYTGEAKRADLQIGYNFNHSWQLLYTIRSFSEDVRPGTLKGVATIAALYPNVDGLGLNRILLNRLAIVYDTRDDLTVPRAGLKLVAFGGVASRNGFFDDSAFTEFGVDGRSYLPLAPDAVLVTHMALRYLPSAKSTPFWALSGLGGSESTIGGDQPLRGFGAGRFYDRNSFDYGIELRRTLLAFDAAKSHVDVEITPFVDLGRVFANDGSFPVGHLHRVGGIGFRGIAKPFVVGYVDIGYGSEGVAAFTGINYPF